MAGRSMVGASCWEDMVTVADADGGSRGGGAFHDQCGESQCQVNAWVPVRACVHTSIDRQAWGGRVRGVHGR
jgi:hypothetical protein